MMPYLETEALASMASVVLGSLIVIESFVYIVLYPAVQACSTQSTRWSYSKSKFGTSAQVKESRGTLKFISRYHRCHNSWLDVFLDPE